MEVDKFWVSIVITLLISVAAVMLGVAITRFIRKLGKKKLSSSPAEESPEDMKTSTEPQLSARTDVIRRLDALQVTSKEHRRILIEILKLTTFLARKDLHQQQLDEQASEHENRMSSLLGLDPPEDLRAFCGILISKNSWDKEDLQAQALECGLMLNDAIYRINNWADEYLSDYLVVEEDERFIIRWEILQKAA